MSEHLRSSESHQVVKTEQGRFLVWTECGRQVDAMIVDNESATCPECNEVDAHLQTEAAK
jgi:hypothetical protein